jgi:hypothetical protein
MEFVAQRESLASEGLDKSFRDTDLGHVFGVVNDRVDVAGEVKLMEDKMAQSVERSARTAGELCMLRRCPHAYEVSLVLVDLQHRDRSTTFTVTFEDAARLPHGLDDVGAR